MNLESPPADPDSPDHSTCRNCGQSISWDEVCYTHDSSGFSNCGTTISGGSEPRGWIKRAIEKAGVVGTIDPTITVDPAMGGKIAEPVEWGVK